MSPIKRFSMITFGFAALLAVIIWWRLSLSVVWSWLLAINLICFLAYGYDKAIAGSERTRVPERVLLTLTLVGGTIGAMLGQTLFRHKTIKSSYRTRFWLIVALQICLVSLYVVFRQS